MDKTTKLGCQCQQTSGSQQRSESQEIRYGRDDMGILLSEVIATPVGEAVEQKQGRMAAKDRRLHRKRTQENEDKGQHTKITAASLRAILERQDYKCALTGERMTPEGSSLDHKTPLSRGGSHSIDNLQFITTEANRMKGEMTDGEFIAVCQSVARNAQGGRG